MTVARPAIGRDFWRGFPALLLAFLVAQAAQQVDVSLLARFVGGEGVTVYVLLLRLALVDLVATMALGSVISVTVGHAAREGREGLAIRWSLALSLLAGGVLGCAGALLYPAAAPWMAGGDAGAAAELAAAIPWFCAATPVRLVNGSATFMVHAVGAGGVALRWKLAELAGRTLLVALVLGPLEAGLVGCFVAGLLLNALSAAWGARWLLRHAPAPVTLPARRWMADLLGKALWETQRLLSAHLLALAGIALFASPLLVPADTARLGAFAAGTVMAALVFAPFVALLRFLAMRLAGRSGQELPRLVTALLRLGVPAGAAVGLALVAVAEPLGAHVYGQGGPWWVWFVAALGLSLPFRAAANIVRAALQATGGFAGVAVLDAVLGWGVGLPLIVAGLWLDVPAIAYASLCLPEALAALWLWRRFQARTRSNAGGVAAMVRA